MITISKNKYLGNMLNELKQKFVHFLDMYFFYFCLIALIFPFKGF